MTGRGVEEFLLLGRNVKIGHVAARCSVRRGINLGGDEADATVTLSGLVIWNAQSFKGREKGVHHRR